MKPTDLNGKIVLFQDEDKKWWNTKLHIEKIRKDAEFFHEELKKNKDKFEYILGYQGQYGKHCVYVNVYDPRKKLAVCINSSVQNSATFPVLLLKSSKKVVFLNKISSK